MLEECLPDKELLNKKQKALKMKKEENKEYTDRLYKMIIETLNLYGSLSAEEIQKKASRELDVFVPPAIILNRLNNLVIEGEIVYMENSVNGFTLKMYTLPWFRGSLEKTIKGIREGKKDE